MGRQRSLMKRDRDGLGGFFEAILAVMIVTSGFTVLLVSVNLAQAEGRNGIGDNPGDQVRAVCQRLLEDERLFRPPYVLLLANSYLWGEIVEAEMSEFTNYSVTLIVDPDRPRPILLAQKGSGDSTMGMMELRIPVNVQLTPSTIHVGILELRVGA